MFEVRNIGLIPYNEAWELQEKLRQERATGKISDTLIICEHPRVFTLGRQDCQKDWRTTIDVVKRAGIDVVYSNRGGRITYHGPGQIVGYFIFNLLERGLGIKQFVNLIEELLINTVGTFNISAQRDKINPGIWVGLNKLGAIGLHVSKNITQHGFALNHQVSMDDYQYIVPCGLETRGVTSINKILDATKLPTRQLVCEEIENQLRLILDGNYSSDISSSAAKKVSPPSAAGGA